MGKPIGLGRVLIETVGLLTIDRETRYTTEGFFSPRYSRVWTSSPQEQSQWPEYYREEKSAQGAPLDLARVWNSFVNYMDADIRKALELIGTPSALQASVHTPLVQGQEQNPEKETFRWFVANDSGSGKRRKIRAQMKCLQPLNASSQKMPTLPEHPWSDE